MGFLGGGWPQVTSTAMRAEASADPDLRTDCFYARRTLELAVAWAYKHDGALKLPYQDNLSALLREPSFKTAAGEAVFTKSRLIVTLSNQAVHSNAADSRQQRGIGSVRAVPCDVLAGAHLWPQPAAGVEAAL